MIHRAKLTAKGLIYIAFFVLASCGGGSNGTDTSCLGFDLSDLTLTDLTVSESSLDQTFSSSVLNGYTVSVGNDVESISFTTILNETALANNATITAELVEAADVDADTIESLTVISGTAFSFDLAEGDNFITITIESEKGCQFNSYEVLVHRENSVGQLDGVFRAINDGGLTNTDDGTDYSVTDFDPAVHIYNITAEYETCRLGLAPFVIESESTITINGEETENLTFSNFNLPLVGTTEIVFNVTSEVGENSQEYAFNIIRSSTDEEVAADATLQDMQLSAGTLDSDYSCTDTGYSLRLDRQDTSTELVLTPSAAEATMTITHIVGVNDVPDFDDDTVITAGTPFALSNGTDPERFAYNITVTSADGTESTIYALNVTRSETNWKYVSTVTELQEAMRSPANLDEIIIDTSDDDSNELYFGVASVDTSGHDGAHFYAGELPEDFEKVVVRGDGGDVTLSGDDVDANAVLLVEGDNWEIRSVTLTGARNGVVLSGANNTFLSGISIEDVGERGLYMHNGSSNNVISNSSIFNTGMSLSGETEESQGEAIVVGEEVDDTTDFVFSDNNYISNMVFGTDILTESVDVNNGATNTKINHSLFVTAGIDPVLSEQSSIVAISGEGTDYSYNMILHTNDELIDSGLTISGDVGGVRIFDNLYSLNDMTDSDTVDDVTINAITVADDSSVGVNSNLSFLVDEDEDGEYDSAVVEGTVTEIESPIYQIQSTIDPTLCLVRKDDVSFDFGSFSLDDAEISTSDIMVMEACVDNTPAQQWAFTYDLNVSISTTLGIINYDRYVRITNVSSGSPLVPLSTAFASTLTFAGEADVVDTSTLDRWIVNKLDGENVSFLPFLNNAYALSESVGDTRINTHFVDGDNGLYLGEFTTSNAQTFRLIEQ